MKKRGLRRVAESLRITVAALIGRARISVTPLWRARVTCLSRALLQVGKIGIRESMTPGSHRAATTNGASLKISIVSSANTASKN